MSKLCPECSYKNENRSAYCLNCSYKFNDQNIFNIENSSNKKFSEPNQIEETEQIKNQKLILNLQYRIKKLENRVERLHNYDNTTKFIDFLYFITLIGLIGLFISLMIALFSNSFFVSPLIIFFGLIFNIIYFMSLREIRNIVKRH